METPQLTPPSVDLLSATSFSLPHVVGVVLLLLAASGGFAVAHESGGSRGGGGFGGGIGVFINPMPQPNLDDYWEQQGRLDQAERNAERAIREMNRGGTTYSSPSGSTGKKTQTKTTPPVQPTYTGPLPRADALGKGKTTYTYEPVPPGRGSGVNTTGKVRIHVEDRPKTIKPVEPIKGWTPGKPDPNWRSKETLPRADTLGKGPGPGKPGGVILDEGKMGKVPPTVRSPTMTATGTSQGTMPGKTAGVQPGPSRPGIPPIGPPIIIGSGGPPGGGWSSTNAAGSALGGLKPSPPAKPIDASQGGYGGGSVGGDTTWVPDASQWTPTTDWQVRIAWSASASLGPAGVSKVVIDLRPVSPVPDMPGHWIHDTEKGPEARLTFGSVGLEGPSADVGWQVSPSEWQKIKTQRPVIPHDFEGGGSWTSGAGAKMGGAGGSFGTVVKFENVKFAGDTAWGKEGEGLWLESPGVSGATGLGGETGGGTGAAYTGVWKFE